MRNLLLTLLIFGAISLCSASLFPDTENNPRHQLRPQATKSQPVLSDEEIAVRKEMVRNIPVLQWMDPEGREPTSYAEWNKTIGKQLPLSTQLVFKSGYEKAGKICVIVNNALYNDIEISLNQYSADLIAEGYSVEIYSSSEGTPEEIRAFLQGRYAEDMEGCLLIGDLPIPWYEVDCWGKSKMDEFPCDLFYMDLDGVFGDIDSDGMYDSHTGDVGPEIWVGRLTASPLTFGGSNEVSLLQNYFDKNHRYRTGELSTYTRAMVFIDDDWIPWADEWNSNVGLAYATRDYVKDGDSTIDTEYEARFYQGFEFVQLCAHSGPSAHYFKIPPDLWEGGITTNTEVRTIDPEAIFYNLFACSNARYIESDYMGGWYIFCQDYGLGAIGSTKSGSMLNFDLFYGPFGGGATIGEAFRDWFEELASWGFTQDDVCWFYGMTLLGDPTLVKQDPMPLVITTTELANGNVDMAYFQTITIEWGAPPYTCEIFDGALPSGLTLDEDGLSILGIPTELGTFNFSIEARDAMYPMYADTADYIINIITVCGDANGDSNVDLLDITFLIKYKYKDGLAPNPMITSDVNSDYNVDLLDILHLINYKYKSGPDPDCPL